MDCLRSYTDFMAGDEGALLPIVEKYSDNLVYYAYQGVKNFPLAEEAAVNAIFSLVSKGKKFKSEDLLALVLYDTLNRALNKNAKTKNIKTALADRLPETSEDEWAKDNLIQTAGDRLKYDVLCAYDTGTKRILFLYFFQNLDAPQIARVTGKSAAIVEKIIISGRDRLMSASAAGLPFENAGNTRKEGPLYDEP